MRNFKTGATRDNDNNKNDYVGFLDPTVIERYGNYMTKHRKQADGKLRDSDNWKRGIPKTAYIKSMWRHFLDVWFIYLGYERYDNQSLEKITLDESLCALKFNVDGMLYEVLKLNRQKKDPRPFIENGILPHFIKDGKCQATKESPVMCNLGYACDACPYNKEDNDGKK